MIARVDNAVREVCLQADIPVSVPRLLPGDVHIWWASLDQLGSRLPIFEEILSGDEKARAERFHFERDRNRFIARRGVLREILGRYLGIESSTLRFVHGKNGKPRLAEKFASGDIEFSLSHSNGVALYGFTRGRQIGVDIENIHDFPEMDQVSGQVFSRSEHESLRGLTGSKKTDVFFKCWTRKEALGKATGEGVTLPMDRISVLGTIVCPTVSQGFVVEVRAVSRLLVIDLPTVWGFSAAVALAEDFHRSIEKEEQEPTRYCLSVTGGESVSLLPHQESWPIK